MAKSISESLETAVKERKRLEVFSILTKNNYSISIVEQLITYSERYESVYVNRRILSGCDPQQLDRLLKLATRKRWWQDAVQVLKAGVNIRTGVWVIEQACQNTFNYDWQSDILPRLYHDLLFHCTVHQLDLLLTLFTAKGYWIVVSEVLKVGGSIEKRLWVIEQKCLRCSGWVIDRYMEPYVNHDLLSQCSPEQLEQLLTLFTTKRRWVFVDKVLEFGGSTEKRLWVIEQMCLTCKDMVIDKYVAPHINDDLLSQCSLEQLEQLLTLFTTKRRWVFVDKVLEFGGSTEKRLWVIEQMCLTCKDRVIDKYMAPHINDDLLSQCSPFAVDHLVTAFTRGKRWSVVDKVLEIGVSTERRVWVIEQKCLTCTDWVMDMYIYVNNNVLSQCSTEQLDRLLTAFTKRKRWEIVDKVLEVGGSTKKRVRVIEEACKTDADWGKSSLPVKGYSEGEVVDWGESYILPHVNDDLLKRCSLEQLDRLLTALTTHREWTVVTKVVKVGGSHKKHAWVLEQACLTDHDSDSDRLIQTLLSNEFLSEYDTQQFDCLLTTFTTKGRWQDVNKLLEAGGSAERRVWVLEQALCLTDHDSESDRLIHTLLNNEFLSVYDTQQLDSLLTAFTTKGRWQDVNKLLDAGGSVERRVWVIEESLKGHALDFDDYILPCINHNLLSQCSTKHLDRLLTIFTTRRRGSIVDKVLEFGGSIEKRVWVIERACKTANQHYLHQSIMPHVNKDFLSRCSTGQLDRLLSTATKNRVWELADFVLKAGGSHEKRAWVISEARETADHLDLEHYILPHCSNKQLESELKYFVLEGLWESVGKVLEKNVMVKSRTSALSEACKYFSLNYNYTEVMTQIQEEMGNTTVNLLIKSLPLNQLSREAQSVALRFALKQRRWDLISRASLSQVWEQVRRLLFREAVYQKQWKVVKKWADHTLYDDERWWALEEAYKQKQWDVMLQLADHGLTEIELMRVRYRLAKHADWDVVFRMIGRGVDVTEVREVLDGTVISRKTKNTTDKATQQALARRCKSLSQLETQLTRDSATRLKLPSTARQWDTVLFHLHRHPGTFSLLSRNQPSKTFGGCLLQRAIEQGRWHVVMHLVTLGIDSDQLDSLLTDMIEKSQWGVCRVLLVQGVSVQSCLSALSVFMKMNQWTLVARAMEFIVDDALKDHVEHLSLERSVVSLVLQCVRAMCVDDAMRLQVMQRAMERREGSVVGECISTMQHHRLSRKEQNSLFQQAISHGVLQAVKPLVEDKAESGTSQQLQNRNITFLAAIEQRQWDVVDCCQLQGADIDMKDKQGETPLIREVSRTDLNRVDWKAVEELVIRGADPNMLDKKGCSVLILAIKAEQWDTVRLLIEYHGDIHMVAPYGFNQRKTPLQLLIDKRQGDLIHHTLIWCPDQAKGVNDKGETTLHALALDRRPELMYYQIVRGVNPLSLTDYGHSVLFYAVRNEQCARRMVAECIRLGFSTHQTEFSAQQWGLGMEQRQVAQKITADITSFVIDGLLNDLKMQYQNMLRYRDIASPFLLAVLRGMPIVAHMLYESGSCSYTELQHLYQVLRELSDPRTDDGQTLKETVHQWHSREQYEAFMNTLITFLPYLKEMASTPRRLVSTCRLTISHCLTVRGRHERAVQELSDEDKDFLLFSDLTDPALTITGTSTRKHPLTTQLNGPLPHGSSQQWDGT